MKNVNYSNYQNLKVWINAKELTIIMYNICKTYPRNEEFRLTDQTLRSTSSIMANIAEGCGQGYIKKEITHLNTALGSANESLNWIQLAYELQYICNDDYLELSYLFNEVIKMLHGLIKTKNNVSSKMS